MKSMKDKLSKVCSDTIKISANAIPYVVVLVIFVISATIAVMFSLQHDMNTCGSVIVFIASMILFLLLFSIFLRFTEWVINAFAARGTKYISHYIIKYVREGYAKGTLPDMTMLEVLALLREHGEDGLPDHIKAWIHDCRDLQKLSTTLKMLEEERILKRNAVILEYTRLFFSGRLEDYESLESSIRQFLISLDPELHYDKLSLNKDFSKADIRLFFCNIQTFSGIPKEALAKFQGKVFAHWFPVASSDSLTSNYTKTAASKLPKVSDTLSLESIIENMKIDIEKQKDNENTPG